MAFELDPEEVNDLAVERSRSLRREALEPTWNAGVPAAIGLAAGAGVTGGAHKLLDRAASLRKIAPVALAAGVVPAAWAAIRQHGENNRIETARQLIQESPDDLLRHLRVEARKSLRDDRLTYARREAENSANGVVDSDMRRAAYQMIGFMPEIQIRNKGETGLSPIVMQR